jgi:hypothetical protein
MGKEEFFGKNTWINELKLNSPGTHTGYMQE